MADTPTQQMVSTQAYRRQCQVWQHFVWPLPVRRGTPAPRRGSRRTCSPSDAGSRRTPGARAGRRGRSDSRATTVRTGSLPACLGACRESATRSRGRCSTHRTRGDSPCGRWSQKGGAGQGKSRRPPGKNPSWRCPDRPLAGLAARYIIDMSDAREMIKDTAYRLAKKAYKL